MNSVATFKAFGAQILNNHNWKKIQGFEECTLKGYPTFAPLSSSIKC